MRYILYLIVVLISANLYSQSTFNNTTGSELDDAFSQIQVRNNDYILAYTQTPINGEDENCKVSINTISQTGELNNIHLIESDTCDFHFGNFIQYEDSYYCHGFQKHLDTNYYLHWFFKLDQDLSIIWEKTYSSPFNNVLYGTEIAILNEKIIISSSSIIGYTAATQFLRFDLEGSLEYTKLYDSYKWETIYDILESSIPDANYFYAFGEGWDLLGPERIKFDTAFNVIQELNSPVNNEQNAMWINDTAFLLCGTDLVGDTSFISVKLVDTNMTIENEAFFSHQTSLVQHAGIFNGLDYINQDQFYLGGLTHPKAFFHPSPSYIMLNKMNTSLIPDWQKFYGGDARYILYSMCTTPDGGCIMTGTRYDWNTQYNERDIFVMKVDENGLITSVNGEEFQVADAIVFPNPGTDILYIQSGFEVKEFRMMDINGRMVLQQPIHSLTEGIEVNQLPAGTYLYQIIGRDGKMQHGKWVKM